MADQLPGLGWELIFIAPKGAEYYGRPPRIDEQLLDLVKSFRTYRVPLRTPYQNGEMHIVARAVRRLVEALTVPDSRCIWNIEIKKALPEIIRAHTPDAVFLTGTPFSTFLLAPWIKRHFGLPVVLDYRDPWTGNPTLENTILRRLSVARLEDKCVRAADMITAASYRILDHVKERHAKIPSQRTYLAFPYGFDGVFFEKLRSERKIKIKFASAERVGVFGGFVHGDHNVETILDGLRLARRADGLFPFSIDCFGTLFGWHGDTTNKLLNYDLAGTVCVHDFTSYNKFARKLSEADFLIMPHGESMLGRTLIPTKFFDYLGARVPILYIGGRGQVWDLIEECHAGVCVPPEGSAIAEGLHRLFSEDRWYETGMVEAYERKVIYAELDKQLRSMV